MAWTCKRLVISAFVLAHMLAVAIWNLPCGQFKDRCVPYLQFYMMPTGLWQYWGMFGPEPSRQTALLEGLVLDRRGLLHEYAFPNVGAMSVPAGAWKYRDAKLADIMGCDDYTVHREMLARHVVREIVRESDLTADDFPVEAQLLYKTRPSTAPGAEPTEEAPSTLILKTYRFPTLAELLP